MFTMSKGKNTSMLASILYLLGKISAEAPFNPVLDLLIDDLLPKCPQSGQ